MGDYIVGVRAVEEVERGGEVFEEVGVAGGVEVDVRAGGVAAHVCLFELEPSMVLEV